MSTVSMLSMDTPHDPEAKYKIALTPVDTASASPRISRILPDNITIAQGRNSVVNSARNSARNSVRTENIHDQKLLMVDLPSAMHSNDQINSGIASVRSGISSGISSGRASPYSQRNYSQSYPSRNSCYMPQGEPAEWDIDQVCQWLRSVRLEGVIDNFRKHEISGEVLVELDMPSLKELDILAFGKRYTVMQAIKALREQFYTGEKASDTDTFGVRSYSASPSKQLSPVSSWSPPDTQRLVRQESTKQENRPSVAAEEKNGLKSYIDDSIKQLSQGSNMQIPNISPTKPSYPIEKTPANKVVPPRRKSSMLDKIFVFLKTNSRNQRKNQRKRRSQWWGTLVTP